MRVPVASGGFESSKTPYIQAASRKRKEQKDESTEHCNKQLQRKKLSTRLLKKVLLFRGEEATVTKLEILLFCFFREPTDCLISSSCLQTELNFWKAWGIDFFPSATKQDESTSAQGKMDTYLLTIVSYSLQAVLTAQYSLQSLSLVGTLCVMHRCVKKHQRSTGSPFSICRDQRSTGSRKWKLVVREMIGEQVETACAAEKA